MSEEHALDPMFTEQMIEDSFVPIRERLITKQVLLDFLEDIQNHPYR